MSANDGKISNMTNMSGSASVDRSADFLEISDTSGPTTYKATPNFILGITGNPVGHTDTQTLSNKTLGNTNTLTLKDNLFTLQDNGDVTKQGQFDLSGNTTGTTRIYTLPNATGTLVDLASSQILLNKTLTSPVITGGSIDNTTVTVDSVAGHTSANTGTIYGISVTAGQLGAAAIASGAITYPKLGTDSSYAYTSYTPTVSSLSGTITTSSATGRYTQIGKTVFGRLDVTITTNGTGASGVTATLPVTAQANNAYVGSGREDGVSGKTIQAQLSSSTTIARIFFYDGSYPGANSAVLRISFIYEAA